MNSFLIVVVVGFDNINLSWRLNSVGNVLGISSEETTIAIFKCIVDGQFNFKQKTYHSDRLNKFVMYLLKDYSKKIVFVINIQWCTFKNWMLIFRYRRSYITPGHTDMLNSDHLSAPPNVLQDRRNPKKNKHSKLECSSLNKIEMYRCIYIFIIILILICMEYLCIVTLKPL